MFDVTNLSDYVSFAENFDYGSFAKNFGTTATAFLAMVAAIGAWRSADASRDTYRANLYLAYGQRYNSPEMYAAVKLLTDYYKRDVETFETRWRNDLKTADPEVLHINQALRVVNRYYLDIARLYDNKFVDRDMASVMASQRGINVFYKICLPMAYASHPAVSVDQKLVRVLRSIRKRYDSGEII